MSGNSSSSNDSLPAPDFSSISSSLHCLIATPTSIIFTTFNISYILLLLPLCIFILHHGLQLWRQKKSSTSSAASVSHTDIFTYHTVAFNLVGVCGCVFNCCGVYEEGSDTLFAGTLLFGFTWFGETFFHVLTCVERYLAVVHPITYLSLRNQRGIRIRNISISCVWLLSFVMIGLIFVGKYFGFVNLVLSLFSLTIISFCSLSVLCGLIRPGPGEQGGARGRVDRSKLRAFYTMMTILGALVLRFTWDLLLAALSVSSRSVDCLMITCHHWFTLLCSLVLPLLFLHRAGKCCRKNI